ncbi:MAG TPA: GNAT family N-acetyltransferase [Candidatus Poseidoniaceae archaeon]|nr:hypothetical protein [Euryarchaeota archaeon]DAC58391.1 MAG TPA: N-acetyltransferase [Candidatus Poseidoniales archaeon]HII37605.1 GNAT family N-acetyltransferase [Candidatus Poseidoniaceae archaeon]
MPENWQAKVTELFKIETGEIYSDTTFRMLGIPEWHGNKLLVDTKLYPQPDSLMGVLWSKPIFDDRIRIVSLVLDVQAQNQNYGTEVLTELKSKAKSDGKHMIQLEVRKSNVKAQNFYSRHGLKIDKTINGYYSNEDGLLMIGEL